MNISKVTNTHKHFVTGFIAAVVFASVGAYIIFGAHAATLTPVVKPWPNRANYSQLCGPDAGNPPNQPADMLLIPFDNPYCAITTPFYPNGTTVTYGVWLGYGGNTTGLNTSAPLVIKTLAPALTGNVQIISDGGLVNTCFEWDYAGSNFNPGYLGQVKLKVANFSSTWYIDVPYKVYEGGDCTNPGRQVVRGQLQPDGHGSSDVMQQGLCQGAGCTNVPAPAGSGPGGSSVQNTGNAQGNASTGNTGTSGSSSKSSSGQSGSSGGSSANKQGNQQNSTPAASNQGDQKQPTAPEPSPFFDGKQYDPGSDSDNAVFGSSTVAGKKVPKILLYLSTLIILGGGVMGGVLWRKRRNR